MKIVFISLLELLLKPCNCEAIKDLFFFQIKKKSKTLHENLILVKFFSRIQCNFDDPKILSCKGFKDHYFVGFFWGGGMREVIVGSSSGCGFSVQ